MMLNNNCRKLHKQVKGINKEDIFIYLYETKGKIVHNKHEITIAGAINIRIEKDNIILAIGCR